MRSKAVSLNDLNTVALTIAPQDEGVFDGIGVVVTTSPRDVKPESLIQPSRARIGRADLERRAPRAKTLCFVEDAVHEGVPIP